LEIRQFKLANDDEIMCEVVEYHEEDDAIVIRKTMKMVQVDNMANGTRYYAFRPFMLYQMTPESFQIINCEHIIAEANPDQELILEFFKAIELAMDTDDADQTENIDDMKEKYNAYVENQISKLDSDTANNIIKLNFDKSKMH
tara:strand:- start:13299 stop:13727 length:429 start_codon:yes stop_codon:yes gene_type:complete